jgi:hypothetical protein
LLGSECGIRDEKLKLSAALVTVWGRVADRFPSLGKAGLFLSNPWKTSPPQTSWAVVAAGFNHKS